MAVRGEEVARSETRRRNLSRMVLELHVGHPLSRSELAGRLHVDRSTVASLVAELKTRGFVRERRRSASIPQSPGRPSPVVELRQEGPGVLAVDLATDWICGALVGLGGKVTGSVRHDRPMARVAPEKAVDEIERLVRPLLGGREYGPRIVAIGVSVPGLVRREDGFLHQAPALGWRDVPMGQLFRERFASLGVPVFVGNDADLAAMAEHLRGSGRGANDFISIWGHGGVGAGIIIGGQALSGSAGYAGEIGHVAVDPNGELCHCGARGCLEAKVGEEAILRMSGRDPRGGSEGIDDLLAAAERGEPGALAALSECGRWLGVSIGGLVNIFNPTRVSLGGLYARVYPYVKDAILAEIAVRAMPASRQMVDLTAARLGSNAVLLGAAELALAPTLQDPGAIPVGQEASSGRTH